MWKKNMTVTNTACSVPWPKGSFSATLLQLRPWSLLDQRLLAASNKRRLPDGTGKWKRGGFGHRTHETDDRKHAYSKTWAGRSIDDRYKWKIESQASLIIFENPEWFFPEILLEPLQLNTSSFNQYAPLFWDHHLHVTLASIMNILRVGNLAE